MLDSIQGVMYSRPRRLLFSFETLYLSRTSPYVLFGIAKSTSDSLVPLVTRDTP